MSQDLQKICILSGPSDKIDRSRAEAGLVYSKSEGLNVPFKILGAGPDLYRALSHFRAFEEELIDSEVYCERMGGLDHHLSLYLFLERNGVDIEPVITSVTLVQNVLHGFEGEQDGRYGIATDRWHFGKFEKVADSLKRKGRINQSLEFFNVESDGDYYGWVQRRASEAKTRLELARVKRA